MICAPGGQNGEGGIRTTSENPGITEISAQRGAESGAQSANSAPLDTGLAQIVEAWPRLAEVIRKAMLVLTEKGK